jgi:serine-type D-Ala-D-Ala carboxypeptidase
MAESPTAREFDAARDIVRAGCARGLFPAAAVEVGTCDDILWREAFGTLTFESDAVPATVHTWFDLASLTKPLATTPVVQHLIAQGHLAMADRVAAWFAEWRGDDRLSVTVHDLLEHASGLPARLVEPPPRSRREFEHEICRISLEYSPRTRSVYSDLGFILLGFLAADRAGEAAQPRSLAQVFASLVDIVASREPEASTLRFGPLSGIPGIPGIIDVAPTDALPEDHRRGQRLVGEVHDSYAARLSGVAGHSGLFGTAPALGAVARALLRAARSEDSATQPTSSPFSLAAIRQATKRSSVPGSSRALGWDTMLPTSSCGTRMSTAAFGHVGFTGTSLWIDPICDRYYVLLTNRVCAGGTLDEMRQLRRAFHDALG